MKQPTWELCDGYFAPGQYWASPSVPGSMPNYWWNPPSVSGPYGAYEAAHGYGYPNPPPPATNPYRAYGGMWRQTQPEGPGNIVVPNGTVPDRVPLIIGAAGPNGIPNYFFPDAAEQIHRVPICGGPVDPQSQVQ